MKNYSQKDYYGLLGLNYEATPEEIKKAFRKATVKYHPDVNKNGGKIFMEIKEAYEVLIDENERKNYDFIKGYDVKRSQSRKEKNERAKQAYKKIIIAMKIFPKVKVVNIINTITQKNIRKILTQRHILIKLKKNLKINHHSMKLKIKISDKHFQICLAAYFPERAAKT